MHLICLQWYLETPYNNNNDDNKRVSFGMHLFKRKKHKENIQYSFTWLRLYRIDAYR